MIKAMIRPERKYIMIFIYDYEINTFPKVLTLVLFIFIVNFLFQMEENKISNNNI